MTLRYNDDERELSLSVGDLVAAGARGGHLGLRMAARSTTRMRMGQQVHVDHAVARSEQDAAYVSEVSVRRQRVVCGWTITLHGRVDGLAVEDGHPVVEEVKSTVLGSGPLFATALTDWPEYARQLDAYLWMVAVRTGPPPIGRLVLISVLDGCQHVLGSRYDAERIETDIDRVLERIVLDRMRRLAWLTSRRQAPVPLPYVAWRAGQQRIAEETLTALRSGRPALVQAPTGLGKTGPVLWAALTFARAHDKQVFWATARTTHQAVAQDAVRRFRAAGLSVRAVTLAARDKVCLNDVVACSPERCRYAVNYHDTVRESGALDAARALDEPVPSAVMALGEQHTVCPFELALDASDEVDLLIGDMNYAFEPGVRLQRHFDGASAADWVVVVDEAHQLVERARGWGSPRVTLAMAQAAAQRLQDLDEADAEPFLAVVHDVAEVLFDSEFLIDGRIRDGVGVADLSPHPWTELADRVDALALEYVRIEAGRLASGHPPAPHPDPWLDLARSILRFADGLASAGEETAQLVGFRDDRFVGLCCLDPSGSLGPRIAALAGFVGCSATLSPTAYYIDVLGLPDDTVATEVDGIFPPDNRAVIVASRVSTAYRDRIAHAPATSALLSRCIAATPGNVALYFPSFRMLSDIVPGIVLAPRDELIVQERGSDDAVRAAMLRRMGTGGDRVVLAGVLGGVFAEGVDLPPGSLSTVCIIGPGLPPVGLERDLLRDHYEQTRGEGFRYASLIPGLTRVVQAAGRLHRRPEDRGVIVLVGRRFRWRDIRELLPPGWEPESADEPSTLIGAFFHASGNVRDARSE